MKKKFFSALLLCTAFSWSQNAFTQKITGAWKGNIDLQGNRLPIVFHLEAKGDSIAGTWDSPAQHAFGLAFTTLEKKGDSLKATVKNLYATYRGKFVTGDSLSGTWQQGTAFFPLTLKWNEATSTPETVKDGKDVEISVPEGITLSGTLLSKDSQEPLVIIIAGSGPTDRDGNNPLGVSSDAYKMLAQDLYNNHISTFRYDKRGIGKSGAGKITENDTRFTDFASDADSIVSYFRKQGYKNIFIAGHSEGSLLGMLVAQEMNLKGYISIAGAGIPADEILEKQLYGKVPGVSDTTISTLMEKIKSGNAVQEMPAVLQGIFRPSIQPYLASWMQYDPRAEIAKIRCPILIVQGTCDVQIGVENATALYNAAEKATIRIIPGMTHVLKTAGENCANQQQTYTDNSLSLAPGLVENIVAFVNAHNR